MPSPGGSYGRYIPLYLINRVLPVEGLNGVTIITRVRNALAARLAGRIVSGDAPLNSPIVDHGTTQNKKTFLFLGKVFFV